MAYATRFIVPFNNNPDELYEVYFDYLLPDGLTTFGTPIILTGSGDSVIITDDGADDDVFYPLHGSECVINIEVDQTSPITINDFIADFDNQVRVTVLKDKRYANPDGSPTCYWQGFIAVEDNNQPFLDPPFTLSVKAVDGIGLLKGIDLTQNPSQGTATATITDGVVTGITLVTPGTLYGSTPIVTFSGGGGSGARAIAFVSNGIDTDIPNGVLHAFEILLGGSGYTSPPTITLSAGNQTDVGLLGGRMTVVEWLLNILYKTDQTLNLRTSFPFYHKTFDQNRNSLEQTYLDSITYLEADTFNVNQNDPSVDVKALAGDDSYTALEKITRNFGCRLFQHEGVWWFKSVWDHLNPLNTSTYYEYSFANPIDGYIPLVPATGVIDTTGFPVYIGSKELVYPIEEDQLLSLKMQKKWIQLDYSYTQAADKICNQDFSETIPGTDNAAYDEFITSAVIDTSITPAVDLRTTGYELGQCWTHVDIGSDGLPVDPEDGENAFIRVVQDVIDYELVRYAVVDFPSVRGSHISVIESSQFFIDQGDLLSFSVDVRYRDVQFETLTGNHQGQTSVACLFLEGVDGSFWAFSAYETVSAGNQRAGAWVRKPDSTLPVFDLIYNITADIGAGAVAYNQWSNVTAGNVQPYSRCPVSGTLRLYLTSKANLIGPDYTQLGPNMEAWFKNIQITIKPFLNGGFGELKGDYNFMGSNNNIKLIEEDNVEISDSPKRYFRGALLNQNGDILTPEWSRKGGVENSNSGYFRFTQLMANIKFTLLSRMVRKIEGTFLGLEYIKGNDFIHPFPNGLLNNYFFIDTPTNGVGTPTKKYILTSFEKHLGTAEWHGVFVEVMADANQNPMKEFDTYVFNYLFN